MGVILYKFVSLTFGPGQLEHPFVHLLEVVSGLIFAQVLMLCSLKCSTDVMRLWHCLLHLLGHFMPCKAMKSQFSRELRSPSSQGLQGQGQWVLSTAQEVWVQLQGCVLVSMLTMITRKYLFCTNVQKELNHTLFTFPSTSPPVMRKVYMDKIFSAFLSNTV